MTKYDKIVFSSTTKQFDMVCKDFRILDGLEISHKKSHTVVNQKNSTSTRERDTFTNQEFEVELFDTLENLGKLQKEIETFDEQFIVTIHTGNNSLFFYAKVESHDLLNLNNSGLFNYKITMLRNTFFIRTTNYQIDANLDEGVINPYEYNYPVKYSGDISSYEESTKTVFNKGIKEAAVKIVFYDESADGPRVGVNDYAENVFNSYISDGLIMFAGDKLTNTNLVFPSITKETAAGVLTNEAQNRVFENSRGYIYLPQGKSVLFVQFTRKCIISVYEFFESVRGAFL